MTEQKIKQDGHIHLADGRSATLTAVQFPDGACQVTLLNVVYLLERMASVGDRFLFHLCLSLKTAMEVERMKKALPLMRKIM